LLAEMPMAAAASSSPRPKTTGKSDITSLLVVNRPITRAALLNPLGRGSLIHAGYVIEGTRLNLIGQP